MDFNFTTGDPIEIIRLGSSIGFQNRYRTMVEKQESEDTVLLYMPITKGKIVSIKTGELLKMNYVGLDTYNGKYNVYEVRVEVLDVVTYDNISMMIVKRISDVKRVQRRDFFRLNIIKPILIEPLDEELSIEVLTRDISAGGMQALSPVELIKDSEYVVYMNLIQEEPILVVGKVLECVYRNDLQSGNKFQVRFQFLNVEKEVQGDMVKQINNLQAIEIRKRRREGMTFSEHISAHIDEKLLSQYRIDSVFDAKLRLLVILDFLLFIAVLALFVLASPKQSWAPMFGKSITETWDPGMLSLNIWVSAALLLVSIVGLALDRNHYVGRKSVNLIFVVLSSLSLISILFLVTILSTL